MPRKGRIHAESGIYHVMLRGINRQQIFIDREDNQMFLKILKNCKEVCGYKILAYCLMGNHVHLLMKEGDETLEHAFKRIGARFVYWYNAKYNRVGHLFQDRFKSEAVENERYLYTVIGYIHQNPVKAGLCSCLEDYPYSSFAEYCGKANIVDMDYMEQFISAPSVIEISRKHVTVECMEMQETQAVRLTNQQAKRLMIEMTGCDNPSAFQLLTREEKERYLSMMKQAGTSLRQISRLTGVTYYAAQKITSIRSIRGRFSD